MSQPTSTDVHIDVALTDMSIAYIQSETNYIAGRVHPSKPSDKKTNKYHVFNKNDWFRDVRRCRSEGLECCKHIDTYQCQLHRTKGCHYDFGHYFIWDY